MAPQIAHPRLSSSSAQAAAHHHDSWKKSIIHRNLSFVENDVECVISQSPFLKNAAATTVGSRSSSSAALFQRKEIQTGAMMGKGGFSVVYEITAFKLSADVHMRLSSEQRAAREHLQETCLDPSTGQGRYAIKHLQEQLLYRNNVDKEQHLKAARDFSFAASDLAVEACFLSSLEHPNILPLRGLPVDGIKALGDGRHDGYFIITDRLVETLEGRICREKLQNARKGQEERMVEESSCLLREKMEYALQLAQALGYLHNRRLVYRDLKPGNIGFNAAGQLQLFDFGLCREIPAGGCHISDNYEMSGVGTRRYMAVEIVNSGRYNVKADVYGWSMVFWEMLTCMKPYALCTLEDHRISVCQGGERPPIDESNWPPELQQLLRQSWVESIHDRLSINEVSVSLESIIIQQRQLQWHESFQSIEPLQEGLSLETPESPKGVADDLIYLKSMVAATASVTCVSTKKVRPIPKTVPTCLELPLAKEDISTAIPKTIAIPSVPSSSIELSGASGGILEMSTSKLRPNEGEEGTEVVMLPNHNRKTAGQPIVGIWDPSTAKKVFL